MENEINNEWKGSQSHVFWGELNPCDHLVQIYDNDKVFLDSIEGFVSSGFKSGESVIIIATEEHLNALEEFLIGHGFDLGALCASEQYIPLNAEETLAKFMENGWPNQKLFMNLIKDLIMRARGRSRRRVRAYGEMVAILWSQGHNSATVRLEHLWNKFCETEAFCIFCAYPKIGFTQDANTSLMNICAAHTKVIAGEERTTPEIFYKNTERKIPEFRPLLG